MIRAAVHVRSRWSLQNTQSQLYPHEFDRDRLGDRSCLLPPLDGDRASLHEERRREPQRIFPVWPQCELVARRRIDGRDDLRRRHAARRNRTRRSSRRRGQLALVEHGHERNAHRVLLCASVATRKRHDRRRVRRDPIQRRAGAIPSRLQRDLPRDPDQPHHPWLGDARDDQDPHDLARCLARAGSGNLLRDHGDLLGRRRIVGGALD